MKKILIALASLLLVIILVLAFLLMPFTNTPGFESKFGDCDEKLTSEFQKLGLYGGYSLLSKSRDSSGILEVKALIWTNCSYHPKIATYSIKNNLLNIENSKYVNQLMVLTESGIAAGCTCAHIVDYKFSNLDNKDYGVSFYGNEAQLLDANVIAKVNELIGQ